MAKPEEKEDEGKEKKLVLPPDVDPQVKKDLEKADGSISIRVTPVDGKLCADCSYSDGNDYRSFQKYFDDWKQLGAYGEKFFRVIDDESGEYQ